MRNPAGCHPAVALGPDPPRRRDPNPQNKLPAMSSVEIIEFALSDRKLVERFIRVPWYIHRTHAPNKYWVPPLLIDRRDTLNAAKNPFFEHADITCFLAVKDGKDVGRIAAIIDHDYVKFHDASHGHFGFFDCVDDDEIAGTLLRRAGAWLKERGMTSIVGPFDPSSNYMMGVLIEGFDHDPTINMPYNPPYYDRLLTAQGLRKAKDLLQWQFFVDKPLPERMERVADIMRKKLGLTIRTFDFKNWDREVQHTLDIYNDAWEKNWGFVPLSPKEYRHIAKDLKMVLHPKMGLMAEIDGQPVAFAVSIMNLNPILAKIDGKLMPTGLLRLLWDLYVTRRVDSGRLILLGVRGQYRRRGIDPLLIVETYRHCKEIGWRGGELGWTLEDNEAINGPIRSVGADLIARYRMYEMELS